MAFNRDAVPGALAAIGRAIDAPDDPIAAVASLVARLGLPVRLSECGVTEDDLDAVARLAAGNRNVAANPRPVTEADARAILQDAY
jgi:alcohol dehydrogenase class IV